MTDENTCIYYENASNLGNIFSKKMNLMCMLATSSYENGNRMEIFSVHKINQLQRYALMCTN